MPLASTIDTIFRLHTMLGRSIVSTEVLSVGANGGCLAAGRSGLAEPGRDEPASGPKLLAGGAAIPSRKDAGMDDGPGACEGNDLADDEDCL